MGGDFNARIGKEGGGMAVGEEKEGEGGERGKRQSKEDKQGEKKIDGFFRGKRMENI